MQKDALISRLQDPSPGRLICLLDACRYDIFKEINWLPGNLQKVISAGSTTEEWAIKTFIGYYPEVIYISSVPYVAASIKYKKGQGEFRALDHFPIVSDVWWWGYDEELCTVLPEVVVEAAVGAMRDNPGKVIFVHFMQPHCPYVGEPPLGQKEWEELTGEKVGHFPRLEAVFKSGYGELLKDAYRGNLARALKAIESLVPFFSHITITADHGEGFGESGIYGHQAGVRVPELIEVPLFDLTK